LNPCSWLEGTVCSSITISPKRERVSEGLELVFQEPFELARNRAETGHDNQPMWPVSINGRPCHVVRVQSSPLHVAGIFPAQNLRSKEGLREGDFVRLAIPSDCVERLSMLRKFAWVLLWRFRERLFYKSRRYPKIISRLGSLARASEQA
jgi:hypothetical protein